MNFFLNRIRVSAILTITAALLLLVFSAGRAAASPMRDIERLTPSRTTVCFFEGQYLADLVLNARGKLTFLFVDRKLADALRRGQRAEQGQGGFSEIHPQIYAYATKSKRGHLLFIVRVQALKSWKFDSSMLSIGDYSPINENIITGIASNPTMELKFGESDLAGGYDGYIGFFVPTENVKPGETINLGYATDHVEWEVPN